MSLVTLVELLSSTTLVNTNHSNSNGPSRFADTESEISIIGIDIAAFLGCFDDFNYRFQNAFVDIAFLEFAEELNTVSKYLYIRLFDSLPESYFLCFAP